MNLSKSVPKVPCMTLVLGWLAFELALFSRHKKPTNTNLILVRGYFSLVKYIAVTLVALPTPKN